MDKIKKRKITVDGIGFDSQAEVDFYYWLCDAQRAGLIDRFGIHEEAHTVKLSRKWSLHTMGKNIAVREAFYTPDAWVMFPSKHLDRGKSGCMGRGDIGGNYEPKTKLCLPWAYHDSKCHNKAVSLIDVKGQYSTDTQRAIFSLKQKWVLENERKYINPVHPWGEKYRSQGKLKFRPGLFHQTWCPDKCIGSPTNFISKEKYFGMCTLEQYLLKEANKNG